MSERESVVESYLKRRVKTLGGHCFKLRFINRIGAPDRLILLPGEFFMAELKKFGKKADTHQIRIHKLLRWAGIRVFVLDSKDAVDDVL